MHIQSITPDAIVVTLTDDEAYEFHCNTFDCNVCRHPGKTSYQSIPKEECTVTIPRTLNDKTNAAWISFIEEYNQDIYMSGFDIPVLPAL